MQDYVKEGVVSLQGWSQTNPTSSHGLWASQLVLINHCIMSARHVAEWVVVADFDEFLSVDGPSFNFSAPRFIEAKVSHEYGAIHLPRYQMTLSNSSANAAQLLHIQR